MERQVRLAQQALVASLDLPEPAALQARPDATGVTAPTGAMAPAWTLPWLIHAVTCLLA